VILPPADVLSAGLSALPDVLRPPGLSEAAADRLRGLPAAFPVCGLELRLGDGDPRIDVAAAVSAAGPGRSVLASAGAGVASNAPDWAAAARFADEWRRPGSDLDRAVSILFVELDDVGGEPSRPGWFLRVDPPPRPGDVAGAGRAVDALGLLVGSVPPAARDTLARCIDEAGEHGRLLHLGALPGRDAAALRAVFTIHQDDACTFLLGAGVPLAIARLRDLDRVLARAPDWLDLHVDIRGGELGARVGVELSFGGRAPDDPRWAAVLDHWVDAGWADRARADAVLQWPGIDASPALDGRALRRELSHLKLSLRHGRPASAKAYLSLECGLPGVV